MSAKKQIFVVEDEPIIRDDIVAKLGDLGYAVCGDSGCAADALSALSKLSPDLCLLDIAIEGAIDGIELAREIKRRFFKPMVFLTSFSDALTLERAKAVEPSGYILKPFDENDLRINIELALYKSSRLSRSDAASATFFVKQKGLMVKVEAKDILWAEAYDKYAYLQTAQQKYLLSTTLKEVEEKLVGLGFLRVHRSYLVNLSKITAISEDFAFIDAHRLPLGRLYRDALLGGIARL